MSGSTGGDNRCRVPGPGPLIMAAASWCLSDGPKAQARRVHETNWTPIWSAPLRVDRFKRLF